MHNRHWIVAVAATALVAAAAGPARADQGFTTTAYWAMDEPPGSPVMHDSSGNGLHGAIGDEVETTGEAYGFSRLDPDTPPAHPRHVVVVHDDPALDPGDRDFAISLRLRTAYQFGNVIQKGQATVSGGSYKIQIPRGRVQCWFRGSAGQVLVTAPKPINDRQWHTVACVRFHAGVLLAVDGVTVARRAGVTGTIANSWPMSIGGKTSCDQIQVGCDYFAGDLDWVRIDAAGHDW
jgi:hypothetical protein